VPLLTGGDDAGLGDLSRIGGRRLGGPGIVRNEQDLTTWLKSRVQFDLAPMPGRKAAKTEVGYHWGYNEDI
jgi:hypothetical protein